jgi:hypothetical protein
MIWLMMLARPVQVLKEVKLSDPRVPVYSNVTAKPMTSAAEVAELLARQLVEPVLWEGSLRALVAAGKTEMVRTKRLGLHGLVSCRDAEGFALAGVPMSFARQRSAIRLRRVACPARCIAVSSALPAV